MIRYMITGLTAAALSMAPVANAAAPSVFNTGKPTNKQDKGKLDLISSWDIAPLFLFTGSMIYMYTVKKQCSVLEETIAKQNSRFDKFEKEIATLEKRFRGPFHEEDEDEKGGNRRPSEGFVRMPGSSLSSGLHMSPPPATNSSVTSPSVSSEVPPVYPNVARDEGRTSPVSPIMVPEPDSEMSDFSDVEGEAPPATKNEEKKKD